MEDRRDGELLKRDPGREILTDERIKAMLALADKAIAAGAGKQGPKLIPVAVEADVEEEDED